MRKTTVRAISRAVGVILLLTLGTWGVGRIYHDFTSTSDLSEPVEGDSPVDLRQGLNAPVIREDLNSGGPQTPVRPLKREDLSFFSSESFRHLPTYRDLNQLAGEVDGYATLGGYQRGVNARVEGYNSCKKQLLTFTGDQGDRRMCCSVNLLEETGRRADNLNRDLAEDVREGFGLDPVLGIEEALEEVIIEAPVHESG